VKGKVWVLSLAVLLCLTLVSVGVVSSLQYANVSAVGPNGINATTFTATKNVWTLFNFSINISGITSYAGAPLNISSILIFLSPLSSTGSGWATNITGVGYASANISEQGILGYNYTVNSPSISIINITANTSYGIGALFTNKTVGLHYVWFYAKSNASYRKVTNFTIVLVRNNGSDVADNSSHNFVANVNDTYNIVLLNTNSSGANLSLNFIKFSVNVTDYNVTDGSSFTPASIWTVVYNATQILNTSLGSRWINASISFGLNASGLPFTINVSNFTGGGFLPNGRYWINITVNNSFGDANTTVISYLTLDTGSPNLTHSCDTYSLIVTKPITCTCSATDIWDTSPITGYDKTPLTNNLGTSFPASCGSTDSAGNFVNSVLYYNVTVGSAPAGSGGGGGGSTTTVTWTNTIIATDAELSAKGPVTYELSGSSRIKVQINSQTHYIGVVSVTATTAKIQVSSTPIEATLNVGDTKKFDLDADGFYDIIVKLDSITSGKAKVTTTAINEAVPAGTGTGDDTGAGTGTGDDTGAGITGGSTGKIIMWIVIIVVIIAVVAVVIGISKNKSKSSKRWKK